MTIPLKLPQTHPGICSSSPKSGRDQALRFAFADALSQTQRADARAAYLYHGEFKFIRV